MAKTKTATKKSQAKTESKAGDTEVEICRRRNERRTSDEEQNQTDESQASTEEKGDGPELPERRKKVQRRRQIDPTTCERDYTNDEIEFMHALDAYKRANGRMFPTCSEILEVVRSIGYEKLDRIEEIYVDPETGEAIGPVEDFPAGAESSDAPVSAVPPLETDAIDPASEFNAFNS